MQPGQNQSLQHWRGLPRGGKSVARRRPDDGGGDGGGEYC